MYEHKEGDYYTRLKQLLLKITRYGEQVPKGYPEDRMVVSIYPDSNNLSNFAYNLCVYAQKIMIEEEKYKHLTEKEKINLVIARRNV